MNRIKKYIAVMLVSVFTLGIFSGAFAGQESIKAQAANKFSKLKTGDSILFGSYEQDNITNNGKEAIEWIVLSNNGKELFVVSKYALDHKPYHDKAYDYESTVTWKDCALRKWLNNEFYNTAFSDSDKKIIKTTKIKSNVTTKTIDKSKDFFTKDNVFLLSYEDMENKGYGFNRDYEKQDVARRCARTAYVIAQVGKGNDNSLTSDGEPSCSWLLRSKGFAPGYAMYVDSSGCVDEEGYDIDSSDDVRPALVIDLSSKQSRTQVEVGSKPGKPIISLKAENGDTAVNVSIESTRGADGYLIYMKAEGEEEFNLVKDVKKDGSKASTATITGLSTGSYSFFAESYSIVSGKTVCGGICETKSISLISERIYDPGRFSSAQKGDIITFGSYEQDNNTENGKEAIDWIVLSNDGKELFVVSRYGLDCMYYNYIDVKNTSWEKCTLRKWLNEKFYNTAFSDDDKKLIKTKKLKNKDIPKEDTKGGLYTKDSKDTKDNVFLLSYEDVTNAKYGFSSDLSVEDTARLCAPTEYAIAKDNNYYNNGLFRIQHGERDELTCWWWLRTSGGSWYPKKAMCIFDNGYANYYFYLDVQYECLAVRPALILNLEQATINAKTTSKPAKPVITLETAKNDTAVKVTIEATTGADGYRIYMKAKGSSKYKEVKTVSGSGITARSATITGLSDGKYSFKVKAYSKSSGKTVWGSYSKAKSIKLASSDSDPAINTSPFGKAKTGDIILFGSYEQDNNKKNGKEAIEWKVLSNDGRELLVVSKYVLDCQPYNTKKVDITWEKCTLRKWLNNDFYNAAFSASDKKLIKKTNLMNNDNPIYYITPGGNDTKDNIFLLSLEDVRNTDYGFKIEKREDFGGSLAHRCAPTAYAVAQGVNPPDASWGDGDLTKTSDGKTSCGWWLRSPGEYSYYAANIEFMGSKEYDGREVNLDIGVRPAMIIKLEP